eukprot:TRINITY_DN4315_c0_g1_i1.p1 TRINITY_DN4315_c0_g1~~TRINITY_DN4315_c0_g1_i1.p1  ORF type:complete len:333 (-),score=59.65 TRINITY_DN4315_c0_g1_i1:7-1005(-)
MSNEAKENIKNATVILIIVAGFLCGLAILLRHCCLPKLISHHLYKRITRASSKKSAKKRSLLKDRKSQDIVGVGVRVEGRRMFDDLDNEMKGRKSEGIRGSVARPSTRESISKVHKQLMEQMENMKKNMTWIVQQHTCAHIISDISQSYHVFAFDRLFKLTAKCPTFCQNVRSISSTVDGFILDSQSVSNLEAEITNKIQWHQTFMEECGTCVGMVHGLAYSLFVSINEIYDNLRMASVPKDHSSECDLVEYVFQLLSIHDKLKTILIFLQFMKEESDSHVSCLFSFHIFLKTKKMEDLHNVKIFKKDSVIEQVSKDVDLYTIPNVNYNTFS